MTLGLVSANTELFFDDCVAPRRSALASFIVPVPHPDDLWLEELKGFPRVRVELDDDSLDTDQSDGSFVLTQALAEYYLDVMLSILGDDREYFVELTEVAACGEDVDRMLGWIEVELQQAIESRVGRVFPSEQELLDELFAVLESLQDRTRELLLN